MKWENRGRSRNLEDRRGGGGGRGAGIPLGIGGTLVLLVLSLVFGVDLFSVLGITSPQGSMSSRPPLESNPAEEELADFMSFLIDDTQEVWRAMFVESGVPYEDATLVLFRDRVESACGVAPSSVGPFYCPLDAKVYLDFAFYDTLRGRYGAPGDFAQAYVVAHEIGHHVQNLLGTASEVRQAQQARPGEANQLSVALELQADCYAGVYGSSAQSRGLLERGDLEEGLRAAAAVGDDRLQRQATGRINTETFTHGSSEQRMTWFSRGFDTGDPNACNTFSRASAF